MEDITVAIDPGNTTGIVSFNITTKNIDCVEVTSTEELLNYLTQIKPNTIVVENFKIYPNAIYLTHHEMTSSETIGAIGVWCHQHAVDLSVHLHRQMAGVRKTVPEDWLKNTGFYTLTKGKPHARDAAKHLLYFLAKSYGPKKMLSFFKEKGEKSLSSPE